MPLLNNFTARLPWEQQNANPHTVGMDPNQGMGGGGGFNQQIAQEIQHPNYNTITGKVTNRLGEPMPFNSLFQQQQQHPMMQPPPQAPAGPPAPMAMPPPPPMNMSLMGGGQAPQSNPQLSAMNQALMGQLGSGAMGMTPTATQVPPAAAAAGGQNRNLTPLTGA